MCRHWTLSCPPSGRVRLVMSFPSVGEQHSRRRCSRDNGPAMSQENVELVLSIQPPTDLDVARLFRDDELWAASVFSTGGLTHLDFECVLRGGPEGDQTYIGTGGMRRMFLEWLAPLESY